jgi:hypothetical protein
MTSSARARLIPLCLFQSSGVSTFRRLINEKLETHRLFDIHCGAFDNVASASRDLAQIYMLY